jgi:hypothetical protein
MDHRTSITTAVDLVFHNTNDFTHQPPATSHQSCTKKERKKGARCIDFD